MSIIEKNNMGYDIVSSLDNLYSTYSIYRTIIVCDDNDLNNYKHQLEKNDHTVYTLEEYNDIDYDIIDTRIFIIKDSNFINFVTKYNNYNDNRYFYNMIFFTSQNNKDALTKEYKSIINNDNIII